MRPIWGKNFVLERMLLFQEIRILDPSKKKFARQRDTSMTLDRKIAWNSCMNLSRRCNDAANVCWIMTYAYVERRELQNNVNADISIANQHQQHISQYLYYCYAISHMWEIMTSIIKNKFFPYGDATGTDCGFLCVWNCENTWIIC